MQIIQCLTYHIAEIFTSGSLCLISCCLSQCQIHQKFKDVSNGNKMTKARSRSNVLEMRFEQIPSQRSECSSLSSEPPLGDVSEVSTVKGAISEIMWSAVFDLINLLGEIPCRFTYICFPNVTSTIPYAYLIKHINIHADVVASILLIWWKLWWDHFDLRFVSLRMGHTY